MVKMPKNLIHALNQIRVKCKVDDGLESRGCDEEVKFGDFSNHRLNLCTEKCEECEERRVFKKHEVKEFAPKLIEGIGKSQV